MGRPTRRSRWFVSAARTGLFASCAVLAACTHELREEHARRYHCPLDETKVTKLAPGRLETRGCGYVVTYACPGRTNTCKPVELDGPAARASEQEAAQEAQAELAATRTISAKCSGKPSLPAVQMTPYGQQPCGLVYYEVTELNYLATFSAQLCDGQPVLEDEACYGKWMEMYSARLSERYTEADTARVVQRCKAYPLECTGFEGYEKLMLDSHNEGVRQQAAAAYDREVAQQRERSQVELESAERQSQERLERSRQQRAAIAEALQSAAERPETTRCVTNQLGTQVVTECQTQ